MAKGQQRSNKEVRKPKAKGPKTTNAANPSKKPVEPDLGDKRRTQVARPAGS